MALANSQHDRIMRMYDRRRSAARDERDERRAQAYKAIPVMREIEQTLADLPARRAAALLNGDEAAAARAQKQLEDVRETRAALLEGAGYPADWMDMHYVCPDCRDTGYIDGEKCSCLRQAIVEELFETSAIRDKLSRENFSTFSFDVFDDEMIDPGTGMTSRQLMRRNYDAARRMADDFKPGAYNMLFIGEAGTGKTFLSGCIAEAVMKQGFPVVYLTAQELFDRLADHAFGRDKEEDLYEWIMNCDLLIIDDLGTEVNNTFVSSQLFNCLNDRLLRKKSTVISTNLRFDEIQETYSERVSSRFWQSYTICKFINNDLRIAMMRGRRINNKKGEDQ